METKAHYTLVGGFVITAVLMGFVFVLWNVGHNDERQQARYDIIFRGNISGLSVANPVLFKGVRVGKITNISLSRQDPDAVRVHISISPDTPVRGDSIASLTPLGITGQTAILISGGSKTSPFLEPTSDEAIATISSKQSALEELITSMPELFTTATELADSLNDAVNEENRAQLQAILANIATITQTVAAKSQNIDAILSSLERTTESMQQAAGSVNDAAESLDRYLTGDLEQTTLQIKQISQRLDTLLAKAEPGISEFTGEGLRDIQLFVTEGKELMVSLNRLTRKIERDPKRFFFGTLIPEQKTP